MPICAHHSDLAGVGDSDGYDDVLEGAPWVDYHDVLYLFSLVDI